MIGEIQALRVGFEPDGKAVLGAEDQGSRDAERIWRAGSCDGRRSGGQQAEQGTENQAERQP